MSAANLQCNLPPNTANSLAEAGAPQSHDGSQRWAFWLSQHKRGTFMLMPLPARERPPGAAAARLRAGGAVPIALRRCAIAVARASRACGGASRDGYDVVGFGRGEGRRAGGRST